MVKAEVDQATKNTAIQTIKQNLINMQAEGALKIVGKDLSVTQARMIEREMQWLGYRATTERMSAEAAKKQDRKSTRLNSSHITRSRMPSSA